MIRKINKKKKTKVFVINSVIVQIKFKINNGATNDNISNFGQQ